MAGENDDDLFTDDATGMADDDLTATLRAELEKTGGGEDDDKDTGGFDAPLDDDDIKSRDVVEEEDGVKRVQAARDRKDTPEPAGAKGAKKPDDDAEKDKQSDGEKDKSTDKSEDKPDDKTPDETKKDGEGEDADKAKGKDADDDASPISDEDYAAAIGGLPDAVQKRIKQERADLDAVLAPFKGREEQLKSMGVEPKDAVKWFVDVNDYAQRDPAGYLAWVAQQTGNGDAAKMEEILKGAAAKMGFKIEKDTGPDNAEDDDPFMSDRERELLEENRQLKAAQQTPQQPFGPDSPQEQARRTVTEVVSEVDAQGQPLRPHFELLQGMIVGIVKETVQREGRAMTKADLVQAYEQAELAHPQTREDALKRLMDAQTSAAQAEKDVAKRQEEDAAATEKAKAASTKIIDGPGQGVSHQPADTDPDMGITEYLRSMMNQS